MPRYFTEDHEWLDIQGGVATVGITDHAQEELGDIVYVELPKPGAKLEKGKTLGSVESVKAVSDIYAPVSGEVVEVNETLAEAPEKINKDPHGEAWLLKIRMTTAGDVNDMLSAADYEAYIAAEK